MVLGDVVVVWGSRTLSSDSSVKHDWLPDRNTEHVHTYLQQRRQQQLVVVVVVDSSSSCILSHSTTCSSANSVKSWLLQRSVCQPTSVDNRAAAACTKCSGTTCSTTRTAWSHITRTSWAPLVTDPCTSPIQTAYIKDSITFTARCSASQRPGLRSASTTDYIKPRLSTNTARNNPVTLQRRKATTILVCALHPLFSIQC